MNNYTILDFSFIMFLFANRSITIGILKKKKNKTKTQPFFEYWNLCQLQIGGKIVITGKKPTTKKSMPDPLFWSYGTILTTKDLKSARANLLRLLSATFESKTNFH